MSNTPVKAPIALPVSERVDRSRRIERLVAGVETSDGAGVKLTRVLTQPLQRRLDPFLMLDAFGSDDPDDYIAGFPDHPHRGFETVTYMIAGRMLHRDSAGHEGLLQNGGVQWMTAGRGVIHSEIPQQEQGVMEGFQLWLNLPGRDKLCDPWYRDFTAQDLPAFETESGAHVVVIAGASHGVEGAVQRTGTEPLYLDIHLPPGSRFEQTLAAHHNAFVYVYRGSALIAGETVPVKRMAILAQGAGSAQAPGGGTGGQGSNGSLSPTAPDGVIIEAGDEGAKLLLIAGRPLNEPIAQYGPFVMNTQQELHQALADYRAGRLA